MSGKEIAKGPKCRRLFPLDFSKISRTRFPNNVFCFTVRDNCQLWHNRLGHPHSKALSLMLNSGLLNKSIGLSFCFPFDCAACKMGKREILPFLISTSHSTRCFDLVHSDVWGIAPALSHAHYKYFVTFIDDFSRFTWVYFLHSKSDVFKNFLSYVEN